MSGDRCFLLLSLLLKVGVHINVKMQRFSEEVISESHRWSGTQDGCRKFLTEPSERSRQDTLSRIVFFFLSPWAQLDYL